MSSCAALANAFRCWTLAVDCTVAVGANFASCACSGVHAFDEIIALEVVREFRGTHTHAHVHKHTHTLPEFTQSIGHMCTTSHGRLRQVAYPSRINGVHFFLQSELKLGLELQPRATQTVTIRSYQTSSVGNTQQKSRAMQTASRLHTTKSKYTPYAPEVASVLAN